jgi:chromosome segregation ATPase
MAFTAPALEPDDWQDDADLAAVVPFAQPQASSRAWVLAPSNEEVAELRKQIAVKVNAAKMLNERVRKLTAEGTAKDRRLAELEALLLAAREDLTHRETENRSLQTSLDLSVVESARLSGRLWDSGVEADTLRCRLDTLKAALLASEIERDRLKAAAQEADERHRMESDVLSRQIEAMATQTAAAETMLVDLRNSLAARSQESNEANRKATNAARERDAAAVALVELRDRLKVKDRRIGELDESRAKLMAQTRNLLEAFEARAAGFAEAEAKAKVLARQVDDAETKSLLAQNQVQGLTAKLQGQEAALIEAAGAVQPLARRIAEAEAKSRAAQSETERLAVKMHNHEVALAEASDAVQMLARRAAEAEAEARAAQSEAKALSEKVHSLQAALGGAEDSIRSLTERAAETEASARTAEAEIEDLSSELQQEQARRAIAEVASAKVQTESVRLRRQVETLTARNREFEEIQKRAREAIEPPVQEAAPRRPDAAASAALPAAPVLTARSFLAATISL